MELVTSIRVSLPIIIAMSLLILSAVPIDIAGAAAFFPIVDIMVIYYWSSYKPLALPDWFVFVLGILRDAIEGISLGVSPCMYLIARIIVISSRSLYRRENFLIIWQGFAITALIFIFGKWMLLSFVTDTNLVLNSAIMQFMVSIAMYPIFHWFFNLVNLLMPEHYSNA